MLKLNITKINISKIITLIIIIILGLSQMNKVQAITNNTNINNIIDNETELSETIKNLMLTIKSEGMTQQLLSETIDLYTEASDKYTNNEIAVIIEDNREELTQNGISDEDIDNVVTVLKNVDNKQIKKILETIDIDKISTQIENGENLQDILKSATENLSTTEKVNLILNMLLSAYVIKFIIIVAIILFIYRTLLRCVIYKKAGKKAWAPFIPIYRNVVMLKICGMSPWWLLLLLFPIIGWAFLWVVSVASKFMLAESFGKGAGFGFGLWILSPIFETMLVFSRKTKYIGFENEIKE